MLAVAGAPTTERTRLWDAVHSIGGLAAITGAAALWVYGLVRSLPSTVDVVVPRGQCPDRRSGTVIHRATWLRPEHIDWRRDVPVTRLAVTLVLLSRSASKAYLRSLIVHGRQQRLLTIAELRAVLSLARNAKGTAVLRQLCDELDETNADSVLELDFRQRWAETPWPQPAPDPLEIQTPRHDVHLDVPWPVYLTAVDCHGMGKYNSAWDLDKDTRRDNHAKATDWQVLEATWNRVHGPEWPDLVDEILDVMDLQARRLGLPPIRPT